ncbi:TetR/AcrR family transcriptional regulator [Desemzia sp. FAM 23990]
MVRERKFTQDELYQATHNLILEVGYEKFSFMLLSKQLHISRAALYKYYGNKDELVQEYLNDQMEQMVKNIESIEWSTDFKEKISQLIDLIFKYADTHAISNMIPTQNWTKENKNLPNVQRAKQLHNIFFSFIQKVIEEGQNQGYLLADIPSMFIIEQLFHSITLPNRARLSATARANYIKEMLFYGILQEPE